MTGDAPPDGRNSLFRDDDRRTRKPSRQRRDYDPLEYGPVRDIWSEFSQNLRGALNLGPVDPSPQGSDFGNCASGAFELCTKLRRCFGADEHLLKALGVQSPRKAEPPSLDPTGAYLLKAMHYPYFLLQTERSPETQQPVVA
jgi:hypothetical protein